MGGKTKTLNNCKGEKKMGKTGERKKKQLLPNITVPPPPPPPPCFFRSTQACFHLHGLPDTHKKNQSPGSGKKRVVCVEARVKWSTAPRSFPGGEGERKEKKSEMERPYCPPENPFNISCTAQHAKKCI